MCETIISMGSCSDLYLPGNQKKIRTQQGKGGREKGGEGGKGWSQERKTSSKGFTGDGEGVRQGLMMTDCKNQVFPKGHLTKSS